MNKASPDLVVDAHKHQQLNEKHLSYAKLFRRIKRNRDGRIEVDHLINLLKQKGLEVSDEKRSHTARVCSKNQFIKTTKYLIDLFL